VSTLRRRSTVRPVGRTASRRKLVWCTFQQSPTIAGTGGIFGSDLLSDLEKVGSSKLGVTVMRTHLTLITSPGAVTGQPFYWMGLKVYDANEITSTLDVSAQADLDWMLRKPLPVQYSGASVNTNSVWEIDLRAKRRCEEMGQSYGIFMQNPLTVNATWFIYGRILVALP
jgi:hypothetical protein